MANSLPVSSTASVIHDSLDKRLEGVLKIGSGAAAFFSAPSPTGSGLSQDAFALVPVGADAAILAVADGMGGLPGGREAAACAVRALVDALANPTNNGSGLRPIIMDAIEAANQEIISAGLGSATTLAIAELGPGFVRPYHVGDSEIMLFGQRGRLGFQSVPHSPVGFAYHAGLLDESEAISHADRHLVSNVLGTRDMRVEVGSQIPMRPSDTLILCSDGLVDNLQFAEICELLRAGPLDRQFRRMVDITVERMSDDGADQPSKPDDLTVIAFRPKPDRRLRKRLAM